MAILFNNKLRDQPLTTPIEVECSCASNNGPPAFFYITDGVRDSQSKFLLELTREEAERVVKTLTKYLKEGE
jgi:hypothetical protein